MNIKQLMSKTLLNCIAVFSFTTLIGYTCGVLISDTFDIFEFNGESDTYLIVGLVVGGVLGLLLTDSGGDS